MGFQRQAKPSNRIVARALLDKDVVQPHSSAKYAAAFFKMSGSSVTRRVQLADAAVQRADHRTATAYLEVCFSALSWHRAMRRHAKAVRHISNE